MIRRIALAAVVAFGLSAAQANTYYVADGNGGNGMNTLGWAIEQANLHPTAANVIQFNTGVSVSSSTQYLINANVTINGDTTGASVVDMNGKDRAFFVVGGTVNFNNLTIQNGLAAGGDGGDGGGGGAGLGGGIFVANGMTMTGSTPPAGAANVTVSGVKFRGNTAQGGKGGDYDESWWAQAFTISTSGNGGGGGMGGHGGASGKSSQSGTPSLAGGGGGGGIMPGGSNLFEKGHGRGAGKDTNASEMNGANGLFGAWAGNGGQASTASGSPLPGGTGGAMGGGGGGGAASFIDDEFNKDFYASGGGGGGITGQSAQGTDKDSSTANGGAGGFGGGGGGSGMLDTNSSSRKVYGGAGGFGGGGGGAAYSGDVKFESYGGGGGFGGGAGAGSTATGWNGWGGGTAGVSGSKGSGGGGLGAGGAIFAMPGTSLAIVDSSFGDTITSAINAVIGGAINAGNDVYGASAGDQRGSDLFLGANTTVAVNSALPKKLTGSVAGYGGSTAPVPILTKTGTGRLELHGSSALTTISLAQGTLAVGSGSAVGSSTSTLSFVQPAAGTATLATVSETPGGPPLTLQVGTILLSAGTNVFEIGSLDGLSPNLVLGSTRLVGPAPGAGTLAKAGSGVLTLGVGADLHQFTGTFDLREGTVISEANFGTNQLGLKVASGAEMILGASQLSLASLGGSGAMTLQNGGRFTAHQAGGWSGLIQFENSASIEIDNGGGGRIDLAAGVSGTMVQSSGFNGTLSGAGSLILDTLTEVTLAKDAAGFTGGIVVQRGSSLRLPSGFTGPGFIQGSGTSPAHLTVGGSVGNNLLGAFTSLTVDALLPTTNITVGAAPFAPAPSVGTLELANGRFQVLQVTLTGSSVVSATAAGAKHGTAVFNYTSPVAIGGNGTVEVVQFGSAVSLPGLATSSGSFSGTVHVTTGGTLTTTAANTVSQFQLDDPQSGLPGGSLIFTSPGSTTAEFRGAGSFKATGNTTFSNAAPFANFTGRVDLSDVPEATIQGALHTAAQVSLGPYTLSLAGDLDAPLQGDGPLIRLFSTAPASGTTRIASRSFEGTTHASLDLNHAHFTADGSLAPTVTVGNGAVLETTGSIAKLRGSMVGTGTVRFTGVGDRTVGTDGGTDFGSLTLQLGATHLAILSNTTPLQSLANVQMGANSELRVTPSATIVPANTLSATGAAAVHGAIANNGTIIGPGARHTYLVFEDKVTGTGATTGNVKFNGGHNPGAATASGLPGAPAAASYHVTVVDGDLALGDRNTLQLDVGGYQRGVSYDGVDVTGEIWLDGTLEILLADGFMPDQTFTYDLIDAGSFFGQFSAFNLPSLSAGLVWDTSEVNTTGRLSVIPEPSSLALLAAAVGGCGLHWFRGRRRRAP